MHVEVEDIGSLTSPRFELLKKDKQGLLIPWKDFDEMTGIRHATHEVDFHVMMPCYSLSLYYCSHCHNDLCRADTPSKNL